MYQFASAPLFYGSAFKIGTYLTHVPVCWKGRYSCPNSQLPQPLFLFPIPCTRKLVQRTKNSQGLFLLSPGTFKPGDQRIVTEIRPGVAGSYTLQCASVCIHDLRSLTLASCACPVLLAVWNGLGFERFLIHSCITLNGFCRAAGVRLSNCCLIHSSSADAYTDGSKPWSGLIRATSSENTSSKLVFRPSCLNALTIRFPTATSGILLPVS